MMIDLLEHKRQKEARMVKDYLKNHHTDLYFLFSVAYRLYYKCADRYEIRCNVERFEVAEETPVYVIEYLAGKAG